MLSNASRTRPVLIALAAIGLSLAVSQPALAQEPVPPPAATPARWEFLISSGRVMPTGEQSHTLEGGKLTTVQLLRVLTPSVAVTGTFGWARTRSSEFADAPKLDLFAFDGGAELRSPRWAGRRRLSFSAFAGAGLGGRTYRHREADVDLANHIGAYVSGGGEVGLSRVRMRVELRDYMTRFSPFQGEGPASIRNDLALIVGLRFTRSTP